jgi:hypothetical protein
VSAFAFICTACNEARDCIIVRLFQTMQPSNDLDAGTEYGMRLAYVIEVKPVEGTGGDKIPHSL